MKFYAKGGHERVLTQVQGVRLNYANFASDEVIFLDWKRRMDKSVLVKTAMLESSYPQRRAASLVATHC